MSVSYRAAVLCWRDTERSYTGRVNTGSDCTSSQRRNVEQRPGMTATRRRSENGRTRNRMRIPNAFVTQWTGSKIASVADKVTTLARKLPVYSHAVSLMI